MRLPTRLDRYPAKMVSHLADRLIERYARGAKSVLDPFCGSSAVLVAAHHRGIPVSGIDINPIAGLFASVKLKGFDVARAKQMLDEWLGLARATKQVLPVEWEAKWFWFTPATLAKFEQLRFAGKCLDLYRSEEGLALLLAYNFAVRLCSRADQRSPKPFISKLAKETRTGKHFDPLRVISTLFGELATLYGRRKQNVLSQFVLGDVVHDSGFVQQLGKHSHVITSPPYINAQDYFRNFKLELHLLEGLTPFRINQLRGNFVGTERGALLDEVPTATRERNVQLVPKLRVLESRQTRLAHVVHRYLCDMAHAFNHVQQCLAPKGCLVLVCGDNLVGGLRIQTWRILQRLLEDRGFRLFDRFSDPIGDRLLAPKRCGHKGLIKEEVVSAFQL
jgi:hypothetical protein